MSESQRLKLRLAPGKASGAPGKGFSGVESGVPNGGSN
jgi:hypothetical protein